MEGGVEWKEGRKGGEEEEGEGEEEREEEKEGGLGLISTVGSIMC